MPELTLNVKLSEVLFLLLSTKLSHEFLESIEFDKAQFGQTEMGALIQKLESAVGDNLSQLTDEVLEELINSFLPEIPIRSVGLADYSYPMYSIDETYPQLEAAIEKRQVVHVEYYSMDREEVNERQVEPYFLEKRYNYHILIGYCRWREDIRLFRVDRIKSLEALEETFAMPLNFQADNYSQDEHV